jgi:membrane-associated phospholipid phosphatase
MIKARKRTAAQQFAKVEVTSPRKRARRTTLFVIGLIAIVGAFATLTILVKTTPSFPIDLQITRALQSLRSPVFSAFMNVISWPGFLPQCFIVSVLIVLTLYILGFRWESVAAVFATLLPPLSNMIVKEIIQRPRPTTDLVHVFSTLDSYSFPSGHVMFYVGFFGFLWFLVYTLLKRSWLRTTLLVFIGIFIVLVGTSRIYLGQHWASDVLGAYLLGSLTLFANVGFCRWGKQRFFIHQPAAPEKPTTADL